ncbi:MAG: bifunctional DNA-formamidopyrimidine glycosylase/DNA-(apurinic or apyrimidinic site) lyase [Candidatus Limnocylindrales bacterium]|jgi:formamidopyrimidine-DNA glycosylase
MPELPEVETIAADLRRLVTGARIVGASSNWPKTLRSHDPGSFARAVAGRDIQGVGRRGKQLLVWLGPSNEPHAGAIGRPAEPPGTGFERPAEPPDAEPAVMTVHLKMTGQLFVVPAGAPDDRHVHVVLALADGRELRFRDIRKFGRIGLYRRDEASGEPAAGEAAGVLARGAEPLADGFTARRFAEALARRRGRLKMLLLNQDFLAGVGNIYADEALWRARLHPLRDARSLRADDARRLHKALRDVLAEAVERRGSSVDDYTAPEGDGSMQEHLQVYQRAGEPCDRCDRPIRRIVLGGRSTHFCSWCQRLPADQRPAAAKLLRGTGGGAVDAPDRARRGPRWTELAGAGALCRTTDEESRATRAAERSAERARRIAAARKAAATRRAAARAGEAG